MNAVMKNFKKFYLSFALLALFMGAWEAYCRIGGISKTVLPRPSDIFHAIAVNREILFIHAGQTLIEAMMGLFFAVIFGVSAAIMLFYSPRMRAGLYPLLVLSQTIPIVALAPLLLIWFGFGISPKVIIVVLYCFFPITIAVADALRTTDENLVDLLKSMRASPWQIMRFIRLPAALPAFFSSVKIAATYSIAAAIVGEFVGAYRGLGVYIVTSANSHAIDLVFAALFVTAFMTVFLLLSVSIAERMLVPWRYAHE